MANNFVYLVLPPVLVPRQTMEPPAEYPSFAPYPVPENTTLQIQEPVKSPGMFIC